VVYINLINGWGEMSSFKLGLYTLGIYVVMSIASWSIAEALPEIYTLTMFIMVFVISIILWYESIRKGMTKSVKDGIIVSMFFILPYGVMALTTYKALIKEDLRTLSDVFKLVIWTIFSNPMRIIPEEISYLKSISFSMVEPFLIIGMLLLINIIQHVFKSRNKNT
jgi:hypothetical protein